jgi:long-chain fatty acid transport protein
MKPRFSSIILFTLILFSQSFAQNGTRLIGYDALTAARGDVTTGFFDNPSLIMNNPAGLSFVKNSQLDLSISLMAPQLHFKNDLNDKAGKNNIFPLGCLSYMKKPNGKLTYAFGLFTQGGMGADFNLQHYLYKDANGNYVEQPYHSKFAVMQGGASVAYQVDKKLAFGITANLVYAQVEFQMPMSMPPSMMKGVIDPNTGYTFGDMFSSAPEAGGLGYTEVVASANLKNLKAFGFNGKIGIAYKPNERLSFGINYSLPVELTYKNGTADMDMTYQMNDAFGKVVAGIMQQYPGTTPTQAQQMAMDMFSNLGIDLTKGATDKYDARAKFGLPQSLAAGMSFSAKKKLRLGIDVEWINWKKAFDQMDISLSNGSNPNINRMLGVNGSFAMAFPMKWDNTMVIRTGGEYDLNKKITLRAGYVYGNNPVPPSTVFPVFPAIVKHHITLGGSMKLSDQFLLNLGYEYAFNNNLKATANSYAGKQFNNSTSSLQNSIYHVSVSWLLK